MSSIVRRIIRRCLLRRNKLMGKGGAWCGEGVLRDPAIASGRSVNVAVDHLRTTEHFLTIFRKYKCSSPKRPP
jgi:hypothetical protein